MYNTPYIRVTGEKSFGMSNCRNEKKRIFINRFRKIIVPQFPEFSFLQKGLEEGNPSLDLSRGGKIDFIVLRSIIDNSPIILIP